MTYARQIAAGVRQLKNFRLSYLRKAFSLMAFREKIALAVLAALALANAGYSVNAFYVAHTHIIPTGGGEYREGLLGQPRLINPLSAATNTDLAITNLVFSGLYTYSTDGSIIPDLADGMPAISEDQKQYTIKLKQNVKWHDNRQFTADDVIFTIQTLQDPAYKSPLRGEWLNTSIDKTDDYTIVFSNKDISGPFIYNLTLPIISRAVWGKIDAENFSLSSANLEAVGTGPYAIKEIKKLPTGQIQSMSLEAFPYYYNGKANIDTVRLVFYDSPDEVINALHGREIQGFGFIPFDRSVHISGDNKSLNIVELPQPQYQAVFFNLGNKLFADKNVRRALSLGTDRGEILGDVYNNSARLISGPILPEQLGFNPDIVAPVYDLTQAQALLDAAGWKINAETGVRTKNGQPFQLTMSTNDFVLNSRSAELIQKQWEKLNIKVVLNILPAKELGDNIIKPRSFDALLVSQKLSADPDPFVFWHSSQIKNPGLNLSGFNDAEADKLISSARSTTHRDVREQNYQRFQEILADQTPALFLNQSVYIYAIDTGIRNAAMNILYDPAFRFANIARWYIDTRRAWGE
jgi:peptide/nickel transport system substrate-binding protein